MWSESGHAAAVLVRPSMGRINNCCPRRREESGSLSTDYSHGRHEEQTSRFQGAWRASPLVSTSPFPPLADEAQLLSPPRNDRSRLPIDQSHRSGLQKTILVRREIGDEPRTDDSAVALQRRFETCQQERIKIALGTAMVRSSAEFRIMGHLFTRDHGRSHGWFQNDFHRFISFPSLPPPPPTAYNSTLAAVRAAQLPRGWPRRSAHPESAPKATLHRASLEAIPLSLAAFNGCSSSPSGIDRRWWVGVTSSSFLIITRNNHDANEHLTTTALRCCCLTTLTRVSHVQA